MYPSRPLLAAIVALIVAAPAAAQQTSETNAQLKDALRRFPEADADKDGVLTRAEAQAYLKSLNKGGFTPAKVAAPAIPDTDEFRATAAELDASMKADNVAAKQGPLQFPKGNGLRVLMTGHSWVAPGRVALPGIAEAAGFDGHHQRSHTSGGASGSARSIWLAEIGKFHDQPASPILLPAIATGHWDVMTWGAYVNDSLDDYGRWIDVCLARNPEMVFYIQDGWPTYTKEMDRDEARRAFESRRDELAVYFRSLYDGLDAKYPGKVHVLPAGDAVVEILKRHLDGKMPGFDTISEHLGGTNGIYRDGGHLSTKSGMGQLVGYIYFGTLYKRSPETIKDYRPEGIPAEVDAILREVAWRSIVASPFSGVRDEDGDGIGDAPTAAPEAAK